LHFPTNKIITWRNVTLLPITQAVQDQVANLARSKGMPQGLKIESKTNILLNNSAWIAGVDYPSESQEEEEENFDKMHPDKIAQERNTNFDQDEIKEIQDKIHRDQSFPLVVNKNLKLKLCLEKKKAMMLKKTNILKNHPLIKSSEQDQEGYQDQCTHM
jgi:hypothetical protein